MAGFKRSAYPLDIMNFVAHVLCVVVHEVQGQPGMHFEFKGHMPWASIASNAV